MIGEPMKLTEPLPETVREYDISLSVFDNGMYGAFVAVKGDDYGYGCGQTTRELAIGFIVERLNKCEGELLPPMTRKEYPNLVDAVDGPQ